MPVEVIGPGMIPLTVPETGRLLSRPPPPAGWSISPEARPVSRLHPLAVRGPCVRRRALPMPTWRVILRSVRNG
jgi:hypothetical protein